MKYYLIAGEASGDLHASNLMREISQSDSGAEFRFFGGDQMQTVGGELVKHYKNLAYMGVWPVLTHLRTILNGAALCYSDIENWRPDCVILIDYPGFNLSIAKRVRESMGIPVLYYISPKLWAWKSYRIKNLKRDVNKLFSILPFEVEYFSNHDYKVEYVGNPCVDAVTAYKNSNPEPVRQTDRAPVIALLAGSRKQEIKRNLPVMLKALKGLEGYRILLACAPGIDSGYYDRFLHGSNVERIYSDTYGVLRTARAALVTSGTATLETALFGVPQVVCYRMPLGWVVTLLKGFFIKVRYVSLVNLIAGREVVPELVASHATAANVKRLFLPLLGDTAERAAQKEGYAVMSAKLGGSGASKLAARKIINYLKGWQA